MGDGNFEIGILDRQRDDDERTCAAIRCCASIRRPGIVPDWFSAENAAGKEIYIRPLVCRWTFVGLILVDDIDQVTVEDMKAQVAACRWWLKPPIATVRVGEDAPSLSRGSNPRLAQQVEGPGSAGYHYGRLAGFTNRKDEHWTIVPVDIPGSKWWKRRDKPPAMPERVLP